MGLLQDLGRSINKIPVIGDITEWATGKLKDTAEWVEEDPWQAVAVAGLIYGGYALYQAYASEAALGASAGELGGASTLGSAGGGMDAAGAFAGSEGAASTLGATGGGMDAAGAWATDAAAAEAGTGGLIQGGAMGLGEGGAYQVAASPLAGMSPAQTDAIANNMGGIQKPSGIINGANSLPGSPNTIYPSGTLPGAGAAEESFWRATNPYAWMVGGQAVQGAATASESAKAREEEKRRYNNQSYYGVSNSGRGAGAGGVGAGLLSVSSGFSGTNQAKRTQRKPFSLRGA